jgi:hypothetical protein
MKRFRLAALAVWVSVTAGGGQAQVPESPATPADRSAIASCLRDSGQAARTCIGTIAAVCIRQGTNRNEARAICSRREAAVWRERLDAALAGLAQRLEPGLQSRLASLQRSWEAYATEKCAFLAEVRPPSRAPAAQASCDLRETALRAIEVERLIRRHARGRKARSPLDP